MHAVVETTTYLTDAKAAGVSDDERAAIVLAVASDPTAGDVIPGTGGVRKVRMAGKGKGKSGGYRVISYYAAADVPVFLLALVSKGQRADISQAERNALRTIVITLADLYRQGIAGRIREGGSSSRE
ncbi:type II toxin-antitoxin system RelE/ParE family toxin [Methylorubrum extorquens]|uniref:Type II toxin-antitoxin system RelE/ParE family toxin n=1 Tax=Methylorubrum extorquens TaxID=408 RepID=A0AAX3WJ99_METEX|nr:MULTISPECIES: type II toxin-antitoxin system RelE/ParE family toxin [Methylobacteriaceae]KQO87663.1 addiction module toxin RelE [Methylobacterium sp. Leaf92]KQQ24599.1 addiction module toxin RelE [Methylobacterium sp. Leaf122]WHQ71667.1 type II toxin-antitoxin system RelE/ParE family toxin [Methylorubrum extorquens]